MVEYVLFETMQNSKAGPTAPYRCQKALLSGVPLQVVQKGTACMIHQASRIPGYKNQNGRQIREVCYNVTLPTTRWRKRRMLAHSPASLVRIAAVAVASLRVHVELVPALAHSHDRSGFCGWAPNLVGRGNRM